MLFRLLHVHLRPYRASVALVVVLQSVQTAAALLLPTLNADLINNGVVQGHTGHVLRVGAVMTALTLVQILGACAAVYLAARTAEGLGRDLRAAVFAKVQTFSVREVGRFGAPSLITRTTNDVDQILMLVLMALTMVVVAPFMGAGALVLALRQDAPLSLLLLVVLPALTVTVVLLMRAMGPLSASQQERIDRVNRVVREQITGVRVVRAFVREDHERRRFAEANSELRDVALRLGRIQSLMMPAVTIVTEVSAVAVVWFGGHRVAGGDMQIGSLLAFLQYLMQILGAVMMAAIAFIMAPRARVCAARVREVLDTVPNIPPPRPRPPVLAPGAARRPAGHLEVRDAEFGYPGAEEPVLRGVSLVARPGETTAVIGSTGSGKTTLINLVPRLFDVTGGAVLIDGTDVRDLDPSALAGMIGLVPQKPYLFSGTVASNLRYGDPDATDADLWHALDVAQAREFVEAMPGRLQAPIGQGGGNVSGGQRQRLAIARALLVRPKIYLFDDAFSALDHATDAALRDALAGETGDAAVVTVAQRISTITGADRIVVLDQGRVAGTGTHPDLIEGNATYREIALSQFSAQEAM
ncbi:ABC transporter ATP-binding protein [Actinomadura sp. 6K520]|uniref:ABC transporter ATP-binding protein n=1 Tax=Actinomadura sp. 6K520 TaxID=2530364 RepID=UPI0010463DE6|nr:ABC transporter ATP-binding protein [Actinomadura sp. 6K520]TDE21346.1 ABC transporter ATP-binding protein [Actinomadura sp. 6K520]